MPPNEATVTTVHSYKAVDDKLEMEVREHRAGGSPTGRVFMTDKATMTMQEIDRDGLEVIIDAATKALAKWDELDPPLPSP